MLDALPNPLPAPDQFPGAEATRNKFTVLFPCVPRPEKGGEITRTFVEHAASEFHDLKVISRQFTGVDASEHDFLTYIDDDLTWILVMQYVFFVVMLYFVVATLYYFGVKKNGIGGFWSIGVLATTILILVTTYGFGIYINNFSHYNELYGSIGALLIMLFYLWLNANLLLLGFELDQSLGRLKERHGSSGDLKSQPV